MSTVFCSEASPQKSALMDSQEKFRRLVSSYSNLGGEDGALDSSATASIDAATSFACSRDSTQKSSQKRKRGTTGSPEPAAKPTQIGVEASEASASEPRAHQLDSIRGPALENGNRCAKCSVIDLDAAFNKEIAALANSPVSICSVDHVGRGSACPLCQFFIEMKPIGSLTSLAGYSLVALAASKVFGIQFRGFTDVPLFAVHGTGERGNHTKKIVMKLAPEDPNSVSVRKVATMVEWDRVKAWLSFCKAHHTSVCSRRHLSPLPGLRVIDCDTRKIIKIRNPSIEYVTLSYVWGAGEAAPDEDLRIPSEVLRHNHGRHASRQIARLQISLDRSIPRPAEQLGGKI